MNDTEKTEPIGEETNTLSVLLYQHHLLRRSLKGAREKIFTPHADLEGAERDLAEFRYILNTHLKIEDGIFYPHILRNLEAKNINTKSIKEFIAKMKDIGDRVYRFLDTYPTTAQIVANRDRFQKDFSRMEEILLIRISTEEESVYLYWDF